LTTTLGANAISATLAKAMHLMPNHGIHRHGVPRR
jgi:hypothetical protein